MHPMINIAVRAARSAGNLIMRQLDRVDPQTISQKSRNDFVSEVDRQAEQEIIQILHRAFPSHGILAEESGRQPGNEYVWVIDPLDGTTNYLRGFPHFAVSIALQRNGITEHGVIYDPLRQELFTASRGAGATLDDRRIRVTGLRTISGALLGTGFPFKQHNHLPAYMAMFQALFVEAADVRRAGAAVLDLAYVAAGRLDGFWEIGLQPWDMAAGTLMILEAGGLVSDFDGGTEYLDSGNVVCANPRLHAAMLATIQTYRTPALRR